VGSFYCTLKSQIQKFDHPQFFATANLKTESNQFLIEEVSWYIAVNVAPKTQILIPFAPTAALPFTRLANVTLEATENTTVEWKTNALAYPTGA
jgi:hypothetical protein